MDMNKNDQNHSKIGYEMNSEEIRLSQSIHKTTAWDATQSQYTCRDGTQIEVPRRTVFIRDLNKKSMLPSNKVRYARDAQGKLQLRVVVSGVEFDRAMKTLLRSSEGIKTVIFPNTLRTVRQAAFSCVDSLRTAVLNEGLEALGEDNFAPDSRQYQGVFYGTGLRSVVLPSTLKRIEYGVFAKCENLKAIRFPEGLKYLGVACFWGTGIENIEFPASLRTISQASFSHCESLQTARFADGLEVLGTDERANNGRPLYGVFQKSTLKSIELPSTLKRIEHSAFVQCKNLKTVKLPDRLEYIGKQCFARAGLENIRIPPALKTIEARAFYRCENLKCVEFQEGLEKIDFNAFCESGIEQVQLPSSTRSIGAEAFAKCTNLRSVQLNEGLEVLGTSGPTSGNERCLGVFEESGLMDVKFPSTLKKIEYRVFAECKNLKAVCFPKGLEYLGKFCFSHSGLESVDFPASLRTVAQSSFFLCRNLKSAKFADGLEVLGTDERQYNGRPLYGVFQESTLESVRLPSTLKKIEYRTFEDCHFLRTIEFPDGLECLGPKCFQESQLESAKIPPTLKAIEAWAFFKCKNLKRVEFSEGFEKIGLGAFAYSGIECVDLPSSTKRIGAEAFALCKQLHSVQLNEGLETLGEVERFEGREYNGRVFQYSALESVVIPSTLEVLEELTFHVCVKLSSVVFAEGSRLREIGDGCFANTGLKTFEAPPSLRKICSGAFDLCKNLKYVVLNEGFDALEIGSTELNYDFGAFERSGIKEIVLPGTLVKLDRNTFVKCDCLEKVWVEQRCQIHVADYVRSEVDVRVFQAENGNPLESILSSAGKDE